VRVAVGLGVGVGEGEQAPIKTNAASTKRTKPVFLEKTGLALFWKGISEGNLYGE
jgi:hypothetical protein